MADKISESIDFSEWAASNTEDLTGDQVALLRRENSRLRSKLKVAGARTDLLFQAVKEAFVDPPNLSIKRPSRDRRRTVPKSIAVCHLSDTQIGKTTPTYNSEIAEHRLIEYMDRVLGVIEAERSHSTVDEIRFYWGGDMVEGELIFPTQAHVIDQPVIDQAVKTAPSILARMVLMALEHVQKVHVVGVPGNHGRPGPRNSGSHPKTNWDTVCYEVAKLMIVGPEGARNTSMARRCTFDISDSFYTVDQVYGEGNLVVHGHQIRGGVGGFPFWGIAKKVAGWTDSIPEEWKNLYFGHYHQYYSGEINNHRWFCNGSSESDNGYAREELAACGDPKQRLQFFNDRQGLVSDHPIYLTYGLDSK
jgi:hypothetical protein